LLFFLRKRLGVVEQGMIFQGPFGAKLTGLGGIFTADFGTW